jgi:hypothetical protein
VYGDTANLPTHTKRVFIYRLHNNVSGRIFICVLTLLHVSVSLDHHQADYMKITKIIAYLFTCKDLYR